jgi:hypothetical protein
METTKKTTNGGTLLTILAVFASSLTQAQEKSNFLNEKPEDLIVSGYIIGGVALFGVLIFVISKIAAKYNKESDSAPKITRTSSHRHHHHHRVIKKSS